jgi:hypothetical protein
MAKVSANSRSLQRSQQGGFAVRFCSEWTEDALWVKKFSQQNGPSSRLNKTMLSSWIDESSTSMETENPKEEQRQTHFRTPKLELRSCVIDTNDVAVGFRPPGGLANRQHSLKKI